MKERKLDTHDFIYEKHDAHGVRHTFFDFNKFNNFIEDGDDDNEEVKTSRVPASKKKSPGKFAAANDAYSQDNSLPMNKTSLVNTMNPEYLSPASVPQ